MLSYCLKDQCELLTYFASKIHISTLHTKVSLCLYYSKKNQTPLKEEITFKFLFTFSLLNILIAPPLFI
jgi:hypothetical protein